MEPDRELSPLAHKECSRILKSVRHVAKGLLSGLHQMAAAEVYSSPQWPTQATTVSAPAVRSASRHGGYMSTQPPLPLTRSPAGLLPCVKQGSVP